MPDMTDLYGTGQPLGDPYSGNGYDPSDPYGMFGGSSDPNGGYYTDPFGSQGVGGMYGGGGYSYNSGPTEPYGQQGGYSGYGSTDGTNYYNNSNQPVDPSSYQPYGGGDPYSSVYYGTPYGMGGSFNGLLPPGSSGNTYYGNHGQPVDPSGGYQPYGGTSPYGGASGAGPGTSVDDINITLPSNPNQPPGDMGNFFNDNYLTGQTIQANASMNNASTQLQGQMAQVAAQQAYWQGLLQQGQLDDATKRYATDQATALGQMQAQLTAQYQQGTLANQSQGLQNTYDLGLQGLGVTSQGQQNQYNLGLLGNQLGQQQLGVQAGLGIMGNQLGQQQLGVQQQLGLLGNQLGQSQLGVQAGLGIGQLGLGQQQLGLQGTLGLGQLGVSGYEAETQRLQQQLAAYLGQGNLSLGYSQLANNVALQKAALMAQLQGPQNAFAQQRAQHGLNANGVSNAVDAIAGRTFMPRWGAMQGPVAPATLDTLTADTGIGPIPGVG